MKKCDAYQRYMARSIALLLATTLLGLLWPCVFTVPNAAHAEGDVGATAYVRATNLILRKQPNTKASRITQIKQDEAVTILRYRGEWVQVAYKKHKGYVKGEYLTSKPPAPAPTQAPATGDTQAAGGTATRGASLRLEDRGDAVRELQQLLGQAGYTLSADGVFGKATQDALISFQKSRGLTADGLAGSRTMSELRLSAQTKQAESTPAPAPASAIDAPARPPDSALRSGDRGDSVRELQKLLANAGYGVVADGVFGMATEKAVVSFQSKSGLAADGLAGKQTFAMLRSPSAGASAPKVELLGWWNGGSRAFPVGASATVVDVRTGIRFTVRRWGGVNHADVEPATKDDTAAMKKAYGGAWSWDRRPVWVLVGGRAIAASMNGMPHMGSSIGGNNFPGHFCIHMKDSRLHAGNRVDAEHAAAVNEAYNKRGNFK